jgi:branched-chain amino acid transport system ATP-binding protein
MAVTGPEKETVLEIENLHLSFGGVKVLNDISLKVQQGYIFSIIGPNGAGNQPAQLH